MNIKNYIPTLDGWRAIAILIVILCHGSEGLNAFLQLPAIFSGAYAKQLGREGVNIFFALSGFLITTRLISEERTFGIISIKSFYIRRIFRILPAAFFYISVIGLLSINNIIHITLNRWLSTVFFLANYTSEQGSWYLGHFWSLAVEEHFYFFWPFAFLLLLKTDRRLMFVVILSCVIALWRAIDFKYHFSQTSPAIFWGRTDTQLDNILFGALLALGYANVKYNGHLNKFLSSSVVTMLALVFVLITLLPSLNWKVEFLLITVKAMIIPLIILGTVINHKSIMGIILESKPLTFLGKISYSLYLWQQLFVVSIENKVSSLYFLQSFPFNILVAVICAIFSYYLIEKPLIKVGYNFINRASGS
jgi:peptidoglycan/LPS O-acetylase OafA/YrhL